MPLGTGQLRDLIAELVAVGPRRVAGSATEHEAQKLLARRFEALGLEIHWLPFRTNESLYATLALHFGLGLLGSLMLFWSAGWALVLHAVAAISYTQDSAKRAQWLRRLLPRITSRNLLAVRPAKAARRLRLVLIAHADAAFTGWLFHPETIRHGTQGPKVLHKSLRVATLSLATLALLDVVHGLFCLPAGLLVPLVAVLSIPAAIATLLNVEVVRRDEVVPGANDNLSGCAALVDLAERLEAWLPDGVEVDYVVSGAEEAGTQGAWALAEATDRAWSRHDTVVVAVDTLGGGDLRLLLDGEVLPLRPSSWLLRAGAAAAATDERFGRVEPYDIPSGATDAGPFCTRGYDGIGVGRVDPDIGAPRHYHVPSDTVANLDMDEVAVAIDYVEAFVREIVAVRVGLPS